MSGPSVTNTNISSTNWQPDNKIAQQEEVANKFALPPAGALSANKVSTDAVANATAQGQNDARVTVNQNGDPNLFPKGMKLDPDAIAILLSNLRNKTVALTVESMNKQLQGLKSALKDKLTEKLKLMDEQFAKQRKEIAAQKRKMIGGIFGKIFAAIAAVIVAVVAVTVTAASFGAAAPVMAVIGTTLAIALAAYAMSDAVISVVNYKRAQEGKEPIPGMDQLVGKGFGGILKAFGLSDETAEKIEGYLAAAFIMILSIAATLMTAGGAAASTATTLLRGIKIAQAMTSMAQGATQVADGATTIQIGQIQKDIADIMAKTQEKTAQSENIRKMLDDVQKQIEALLKAIQEFMERSADILSSQDDSAKARLRNMA
jgi:hypothetical protein